MEKAIVCYFLLLLSSILFRASIYVCLHGSAFICLYLHCYAFKFLFILHYFEKCCVAYIFLFCMKLDDLESLLDEVQTTRKYEGLCITLVQNVIIHFFCDMLANFVSYSSYLKSISVKPCAHLFCREIKNAVMICNRRGEILNFLISIVLQ